MTNFPVNSTVYFSAQKGTVLAAEAGKRGRTLYTVALENGRTIKVDGRSLEAPVEFAAPDWSGPTLTVEQQLRASYRRTSSK